MSQIITLYVITTCHINFVRNAYRTFLSVSAQFLRNKIYLFTSKNFVSQSDLISQNVAF